MKKLDHTAWWLSDTKVCGGVDMLDGRDGIQRDLDQAGEVGP